MLSSLRSKDDMHYSCSVQNGITTPFWEFIGRYDLTFSLNNFQEYQQRGIDRG